MLLVMLYGLAVYYQVRISLLLLLFLLGAVGSRRQAPANSLSTARKQVQLPFVGPGC